MRPDRIVLPAPLLNQNLGLPGDEERLEERTIKEVVHEAGHTFGLIHCHDYDCVMHASTYVEDVDLKSTRFCSSCESLLRDDETKARATG